MNMKKAISGVMATALVVSFAVPAATAAAPNNAKAGTYYFSALNIVDGDNVAYSNANYNKDNGTLTIDGISPNSTVYIEIPDDDQLLDSGSLVTSDLSKSSLFSFKANKDTNSKFVKSITFESDKKVNGKLGDWVKIVLNDSTMTSEQKFEGTVTFKAKKSTNNNSDNNGFNAGTNVVMNDTMKLNINLWVNNKSESNGGNPSAGDRFYFDPEDNEENTLIWGDDLASLRFDANDDASKFYARLSTKANSSIYAEYGDPEGAELWFFDFVGHPTVPSTSRATLTLGVPWEDEDNAPNPHDVYIYEIDADGYLTDVTDNFTYSEDNEDIAGWSIKTRTLGTYVISDTELDIDVVEDEESSSSSSNSGKDIPNTGSSDMVNVAVVAAVVSLAAASAIAFKKVSK